MAYTITIPDLTASDMDDILAILNDQAGGRILDAIKIDWDRS